MWPIVLCQSFRSVWTLKPLANMADFTSFDSRMNIRPSRRPWAMSQLIGMWFVSLYSATTESSHQAQKTEMKERLHRMLTWKTQMWEKPRQPSDYRISLWEKIQRWGSTEATTSCLLSSPHGGYSEATASLSLTLSLYTVTPSLTTQCYTTSTTNNVQQHT